MSSSEILNNLTISRAEQSDAPAIVSILLLGWLTAYPNKEYAVTPQAVVKKFGPIDAKIQKIARFLSSLTKEDSVTYLTAKFDRQPIGFLYATQSQAELYLNALYVHPSFHHFGVGTQLLNQVTALTVSATQIATDVIAYNSSAISFYLHHGFEQQGESETGFGHFSDQQSVPELHLIKKLPVSPGKNKLDMNIFLLYIQPTIISIKGDTL